MSPVNETLQAERVAFEGAFVRGQSRRNGLHALLLLGLLAGLGAAYGFVGWIGVPVWLATVMAPSLGLLWWQRSRMPLGGGRVAVGPEGLFSHGELLVPRAEMKRAVVMAGEAGRAVVSIQRAQGFFVAVDVESEAEGHRLVSALGLSADRRTAEFFADSPLSAAIPKWAFFGSLGGLIAVAIAGLSQGMPLAWLVLLAWYALLIPWLRQTTITIGTDGVLLSWFGRKTLIRYSELVSIHPEDKGLRFELSGGRTVRVRAEHTSRQRHESQPEFASADVYMAALAERIRLAKEASGGADVATLERKGRSLAEWLTYLRGLTARETPGFREAPVVPETLWKTVENGHAEPGLRAAAAVALAPSLDETGKERLRIAAGVVVAPKLRVALAAAADGDEEALASALSEMEATTGPSAATGRTGGNGGDRA